MVGLGITEILLLLIVLGVVGGIVYTVHRLAGGARVKEIEAAKRDFERKVRGSSRRKQLPKR